MSEKTVVAQKKQCFIPRLNTKLLQCAGLQADAFGQILTEQACAIIERGRTEKSYWESELSTIRNLTREEAVEELIKSRKINEKIAQIEAYVEGIRA